MADENLKDFTINWVLFGLLFFCLLTFTIIFIANNNSDALGDDIDNQLLSSQTLVQVELLILKMELMLYLMLQLKQIQRKVSLVVETV